MLGGKRSKEEECGWTCGNGHKVRGIYYHMLTPIRGHPLSKRHKTIRYGGWLVQQTINQPLCLPNRLINGVSMVTERETIYGPSGMGSLLTDVDLDNAPAKCPTYRESKSWYWTPDMITCFEETNQTFDSKLITLSPSYPEKGNSLSWVQWNIFHVCVYLFISTISACHVKNYWVIYRLGSHIISPQTQRPF